jgi:hypothetical protein
METMFHQSEAIKLVFISIAQIIYFIAIFEAGASYFWQRV